MRITVASQIRSYILKFCQTDKISISYCIFSYKQPCPWTFYLSHSSDDVFTLCTSEMASTLEPNTDSDLGNFANSGGRIAAVKRVGGAVLGRGYGLLRKLLLI